MIRNVRLLFVWGVLSVAATTSAWAQGWALPAQTPDTTVTCAGCPNTPDGEKTVGYKAPITTFTGRFLDSQGTTDWQATFRTARAWNVQVYGNRIYFRIGSSVAAYNLSTFFSRLSSREPLMSSGSVYPPQPRTSRPEEWLRWDEYFYPEDPDNQCITGITRPGCWVTPRIDGQDRLVAFDVDDQGYVYVASGAFGWGLVRDTYQVGAKFMKSQFQRLAAGDPAPSVIAALKGTGNRYFAIVGGSGTTVAWDVTGRTSPVKLNTFQYGIGRWAKTTNADRIAITDTSSNLHIYSSDGIVTGSAPIATFTGSYRGLASDGSNFYSYSKDGNSYISVFRPVGSTYVEQKYLVPSVNFTILRYGAGYLVGTGLDSENRWDARLYKLDTTTQQPTEVPLIAHGPGSAISYVRAYYTGAPGFAAPTSSYINLTDGAVYKSPEGKYYLIICAKGLGDVYEFKGSDSVNIANNGPVGGVNPNVPTTSLGKTFYGDVVRFTSSSTSPLVTGVHWTFGNPESAGDPNTVNNAPLGSQTHQYSGIAKIAAFAPRKVTAVSTTNAEIRGELDLQLEVPQARFKVASTSIVISQPSTSSTSPIVLGDQFVDASDGTVPSHYATWIIDGLTTKTFPYPGGVDVGACGAHSLKFESFYGPYSPGTFITNGPMFNVGLDPASGLYNYNVRPFAASLDLTSATATSLTFTSSSRFSTTAQTLPLTWTWELINSGGVLVPGTNVSGSGTNVSSYVVQKSSIQGRNYRVRLTINSSTPLTGTCAGMETSTAFSAPMNAPDPVIAGGCTNGGSPCSFTANSATAGLDPTSQGWSYSWTVSGGTYFLGSGNTTSRTFVPRFTQAAVYTVQVTASNTFGASAPASTTVQITTPDSQCQPLTSLSWVPTFSGANGCSAFSNCQPGEQVTFSVNPYGTYDDNCAPHTYQWSFSDGQVVSGRTVSRTFNSSGTARVTVSNGAASREYGPLTVTVGAVQPPPPPPGCQPMTNSNTYISYIATSCSSSSSQTTCKNGDVVTFDTTFFGYDPSCANHTFAWTIDGAAKNGKSVTHTFSTTGNHIVSLQVDRPGQSFTRSLTVTTDSGTTANPCKPLVPNVSLWVDYKNANSTCSPIGGECAAGEPVSFSVKEFGDYQISCAPHTFSWDFGDNTAAVSGRDVTHQFAQAGTFPVKVTVNNGAVTATLTQSAKIKESTIPQTPAPTIDFTATNVGTNTFSFMPQFDPTTSVGRWAWNFGDGSPEVAGKGTPTAPIAEVHTYQKSGTYTVTLRVFGPNGSEYPTHSETVGNARRRAARH